MAATLFYDIIWLIVIIYLIENIRIIATSMENPHKKCDELLMRCYIVRQISLQLSLSVRATRTASLIQATKREIQMMLLIHSIKV